MTRSGRTWTWPRRRTSAGACPRGRRRAPRAVRSEASTDGGSAQQVVVSHAFWQSQLGGMADVIGRTLRLDGRPYDLVGVMPADFRFVRDDSWFWVPAVFTATERSDERRHANNWFMLGRLRHDATIQEAQAQITALNQGDLERFPENRRLLEATGFHTIVAPLRAELVRDVSGTLYLLWGGALFVLLIGGVNIANLTLIRATTRLKEFGLRHAFGASRWRLARQLITESALLALLGALLGIPLGVAALKLGGGLGATDLPRSAEIGVDGQVVLLAAGASAAVGVLLGLVAFWRVSSASSETAVRQEGRSATGDRRTSVVGHALVTVQISTAFVLLIGALLMMVSLDQVLAIDPRFQTAQLLTASVTLPLVRYPTAETRLAFGARAVERIRGVPGVEAVGLGSAVPFGFCCPTAGVHAEGVATSDRAFVAPYLVMTNSSYFETLGIQLVEGRFFDGGDTADSLPVVMVDEDLARAHWGAQSPLGRRVYFEPEIDEDTRFYTVVGVVSGHAMRGLVDSQARRGVHYLPVTQHSIWFMTFVVRATGDPHAITPALRAEMATIDPELPLFDSQTMEARIDATLALRRLPAVLASGFAVVAVLLAALGIYGMVAYRIARRTKELAIRIALGSTTARLFRLVLSEGAWALGVGLVVGAGGAFVVRDLIASQLYATQVTDLRVVLAVILLLSAVTGVACAVPARRAVSIDPLLALNHD